MNTFERENIKDIIRQNIFLVNVFQDKNGIDNLFLKVYNDFKGYIKKEEINYYNITDITKYSLIGYLESPKEIIIHLKTLCKYTTYYYRFLAKTINKNDKGSTYLSAEFLNTINNIFCKGAFNLDECKRIIKSMGFETDERDIKNNKKFKSMVSSLFYNYKTPAEEEIDYLADKYIKKYLKELENDSHQCLAYINLLRISYNKAIEGLKQLSLEHKNILN